MGFTEVLQEKDLLLNEMKEVKAGGKKILVANVGGKYYAIGNVCMHMGCSLSDGKLIGENVECPCHGSTYDIKTGSVIKGPAKNPEPVYQVEIQKGQIVVNI